MAKELGDFAQKINIIFKDKSLLKQAFVHRSYLNEHRQQPDIVGHNERLEFLGDAVLELVVTDYLFDTYPDKPEGELTAYRSALVNANTLAQVSDQLGVNDYLLLSKGEAKDRGRARQYILANVFESLVGAIYLDQGYATVRDFIMTYLLVDAKGIVQRNLSQDYKSFFQKKAQELTSITPAYKLTEESGPDHHKRFVMAVYLGDELVANGEGYAKQEAEQAAAKNALRVKNWD